MKHSIMRSGKYRELKVFLFPVEGLKHVAGCSGRWTRHSRLLVTSLAQHRLSFLFHCPPASALQGLLVNCA